MSRSVDLFVAHAGDPRKLIDLLGAADDARPTGSRSSSDSDPAGPPSTAGPLSTAVETTDGRWEMGLGDDLVGYLHRHPFIDDGDLRFTRYPWALSVRVTSPGPLREHPATIALRRVAMTLREAGISVLLVLDLQHRLDPTGRDGQPPPADGSPPPPAATVPGPDPLSPSGGDATSASGAEAASASGEESASASVGDEAQGDTPVGDAGGPGRLATTGRARGRRR